MEILSPGKDSLFLIEENAGLEEDSLEVDHMPVTTMNVLADASGNTALLTLCKKQWTCLVAHAMQWIRLLSLRFFHGSSASPDRSG